MIEIKNLTKTYHNHNQDFEGLKNIIAQVVEIANSEEKRTSDNG